MEKNRILNQSLGHSVTHPAYMMPRELKRFIVAVIEAFVLQLSAAELVESESISAPAEQQPMPASSEPCAAAVTNKLHENPCGSSLRRYDSRTLTDAERQLLAKYPCIDRQQLAELREAFLMLAVDGPPVTPRTAAAIADSALLDAADIATCLRAVGQNPTQADIARITTIATSQQHQHPEDAGGLASAGASAATLSNRALYPGATKLQPAANTGRVLQPAASDNAAISRHSVDQTPTTAVRYCAD